MKGRKALVFWIINVQLLLIFAGLLFFASDILGSLGQIIIIMIVGNGATYVGGQVADAWQKSKYYKSELDTGGQGE